MFKSDLNVYVILNYYASVAIQRLYLASVYKKHV